MQISVRLRWEAEEGLEEVYHGGKVEVGYSQREPSRLRDRLPGKRTVFQLPFPQFAGLRLVVGFLPQRVQVLEIPPESPHILTQPGILEIRVEIAVPDLPERNPMPARDG